jgi:hypothetical protein
MISPKIGGGGLSATSLIQKRYTLSLLPGAGMFCANPAKEEKHFQLQQPVNTNGFGHYALNLLTWKQELEITFDSVVKNSFTTPADGILYI